MRRAALEALEALEPLDTACDAGECELARFGKPPQLSSVTLVSALIVHVHARTVSSAH